MPLKWLKTLILSQKQKKLKTSINQGFQRCLLASQTGIEPAAFRLGGEPSILLRYMDVYEIFSVGRLLQQALRRRVFYLLN